MNKNIIGISFDVGGTLLYLKNWDRNYRKMSDYLVKNGLEVYPQELEAARNYVFFYDLPRHGINNWEDWTIQVLHRSGVDRSIDVNILDGFKEELRQVSYNFSLFDDVIPLFRALSSHNYKLSIVTTIPEFMFKKVLDPIYKSFTHIVHGGNAGSVKGNPKMYLLDLDRKSVLPENNLFVGNEIHYDIEIPKSLKQNTAYLYRLGYEKSQHADYIINSLIELIEILDL